VRAYFDSFDAPLNHLADYMRRIQSQHPGKKFFVLGHSMGALLSLAFTLRHQSEIAGLIVSGAPVNADANVSPLMVQLGYLLNRIAPKLPLLDLGGGELLSSDPEVGKAFDADPLTYKGNMRVRLGISINEAAQNVRERLSELRLPILILHGGNDKMVNPSGSQLAYDRASSPDKTLKVYPGMYHEIMNERDKATVLRDILDWLDRHV
jgi:alpha-beta hydrolase superfamily lysophospholipase